MVVNYKDGKLHGHRRIWNLKNVLVEESMYKDGVLREERLLDGYNAGITTKIMEGATNGIMEEAMTEVTTGVMAAQGTGGGATTGVTTWKCKSFYNNGKPCSVWTETPSGKKIGKFVGFGLHGKEKSECYFSSSGSGKQDGEVRFWDDSGALIHITVLKDGEKMSEKILDKEKEIWKCKSWYNNGKRKMEWSENSIWKTVGKCVEWWDDGIKTRECFYNSSGKRDGPYKFWNCGTLVDKSEFKDGKLLIEKDFIDNVWKCKEMFSDTDGIKRKWFENSEGKKDGKYEVWWSNGKPLRKCNYKNGKVHGKDERRAEDGTVVTVSEYNEDELVSDKKWWNDGIKARECFYNSSGRRDGPYKFWNCGTLVDKSEFKDGKLLIEKDFIDNVWKCREIYLDTDKTKRTWLENGEGKKDGKYEEWWGNGKPLRKCYYKNGKLHGKDEFWKEDGTFDMVLEYNEDFLKSDKVWNGNTCLWECKKYRSTFYFLQNPVVATWAENKDGDMEGEYKQTSIGKGRRMSVEDFIKEYGAIKIFASFPLESSYQDLIDKVIVNEISKDCINVETFYANGDKCSKFTKIFIKDTSNDTGKWAMGGNHKELHECEKEEEGKEVKLETSESSGEISDYGNLEKVGKSMSVEEFIKAYGEIKPRKSKKDLLTSVSQDLIDKVIVNEISKNLIKVETFYANGDKYSKFTKILIKDVFNNTEWWGMKGEYNSWYECGNKEEKDKEVKLEDIEKLVNLSKRNSDFIKLPDRNEFVKKSNVKRWMFGEFNSSHTLTIMFSTDPKRRVIDIKKENLNEIEIFLEEMNINNPSLQGGEGSGLSPRRGDNLETVD